MVRGDAGTAVYQSFDDHTQAGSIQRSALNGASLRVRARYTTTRIPEGFGPIPTPPSHDHPTGALRQGLCPHEAIVVTPGGFRSRGEITVLYAVHFQMRVEAIRKGIGKDRKGGDRASITKDILNVRGLPLIRKTTRAQTE